MGKKRKREEAAEVMPVNREAKDTFFQTVYSSKERLRGLAEFLLGTKSGALEVAKVRPVLFGNKENDLSFLCSGAVYCMMEEQSSVCLNMPYRQLEYMTAGLRGMVDAEQSLYGGHRVRFPLPKLYTVQVGLVNLSAGQARKQACGTGRLAGSKEGNDIRNHVLDVRYDMRLSDAFLCCTDQSGAQIEPDLEAVVHVFDFRMTLLETLAYIEEAELPERLEIYADNDLFKYALVANSLTYIQRVGRQKEYKAPANVTAAAEVFDLLKARGIFVELLSNREVCNMTAATFSRDDILRYQGREEGIEQATILAIRNMLDLGVPKEKILLKYSQEELDRAQIKAPISVE